MDNSGDTVTSILHHLCLYQRFILGMHIQIFKARLWRYASPHYSQKALREYSRNLEPEFTHGRTEERHKPSHALICPLLTSPGAQQSCCCVNDTLGGTGHYLVPV